MMKKKKSKKTKTMMKITTEGAKKEKCLQPQNLKTKQHHPGGEVDANGGLEGGEAIDGREEDEATRTSSNPIWFCSIWFLLSLWESEDEEETEVIGETEEDEARLSST